MDFSREQQLVSERFQPLRIARGEKTIAANLVKAFGQHMLKVTVHKRMRGQVRLPELFFVAIAHAHPSVRQR